MDKDGKPLFKQGDRMDLVSSVDPDVIEDVAVACLGGTEEDAKKN